MLALRAGVPVVPVAIEGSLNVNPKRRWYLAPNIIRIMIGPAVPVTGVDPDSRYHLIDDVRRHVIRMNRRLGGPGGDESTPVAAAGLEGIGMAAGKDDDTAR